MVISYFPPQQPFLVSKPTYLDWRMFNHSLQNPDRDLGLGGSFVVLAASPTFCDLTQWSEVNYLPARPPL